MILTITPNPLLDYQIHDAAAGRHGGQRLARIPYTVGGKGINVARMLKTLGRPALALTFAGGANGSKMLDELKQQGISGRFVTTEAETRVGINLFEGAAGGYRWWLEDGEELRENEINAMLDLVRSEVTSASVIAMSGTVPGRQNRDFYRRVLESLPGFSGEIYIDARGEALRQACKVGGFFIKHNREEAIESFGIDPYLPTSRMDFFRQLASHRIWGAMITDGSEKVVLWDGKSVYELQPAPAREVSAVGCGDATLAGLIYGRKMGMSILESAIVGLAAGAADAEKPGPCAASFSEVQQKAGQVKLLQQDESFQV